MTSGREPRSPAKVYHLDSVAVTMCGFTGSGRDDLTVELHDSWWSRLGVTGPGGTRLERINPLVSGRDLRRWWNATPD